MTGLISHLEEPEAVKCVHSALVQPHILFALLQMPLQTVQRLGNFALFDSCALHLEVINSFVDFYFFTDWMNCAPPSPKVVSCLTAI